MMPEQFNHTGLKRMIHVVCLVLGEIKTMRSATPLFEDYHKYAVELFPDNITFFFDDQPYFAADTLSSPRH